MIWGLILGILVNILSDILRDILEVALRITLEMIWGMIWWKKKKNSWIKHCGILFGIDRRKKRILIRFHALGIMKFWLFLSGLSYKNEFRDFSVKQNVSSNTNEMNLKHILMCATRGWFGASKYVFVSQTICQRCLLLPMSLTTS